MNNEQQKAKELAELLNAFAGGKQLQYQSEQFVWCGASSLAYIADSVINGKRPIRIKPETKRISLGHDDILVGKVVRKKYSGYLTMIVSQCSTNVMITAEQNHIGDRWYSYEQLMDLYEFADGTPCYKEVECE